MTELQDLGIDNGAGFSAVQDSSGFSVGDLWGKKAHYDFTELGGTLSKVKGKMPMPSQAKIDRFEKSCVLLEMELQKVNREWIRPYETLGEEAEEAEFQLRQAKLESDEKKRKKNVEKWKAEMERLENQATITEEQLDAAYAKRDGIYDHYRDAVAAFCSGHPTRKQLGDVPANFLMPFVNYIRGTLLDPNA